MLDCGTVFKSWTSVSLRSWLESFPSSLSVNSCWALRAFSAWAVSFMTCSGLPYPTTEWTGLPCASVKTRDGKPVMP